MAAARWEFWIDVGGTFTDCLAKAPDGSLRRHKLLSSGVTKGRVGSGSSQHAIVDAARCDDPADFWTGWQLSIVGANGRELDRATITGFDRAGCRLALRGLASAPPLNAAYELRCDADAPVVAIRYILSLPLAKPVPPVVMRLGTTRGTNALLTRTGARTALVTTRGFGDVLEIGYQARPRLFDLTVRKPPALTAAAIEIDERMTHDGKVLVSPSEAEVRQQFQSLLDAGIESLAVCLIHADRYGEHEELIGRVASEVGFAEVSLSNVVAPLPKFVARADTTVVDAYLNPVLRDYVSRLRAALPGSAIRILTSAGGLVGAEYFSGKDSILSGPAGGVVGFSRVAAAAGFSRAIGFDMGGTSTDVSRFDGRFDLEYETQKAGVRLVAPTMAIETVAAGGGSICRFDGAKLIVGPESAGAEPGPACYGRGGPLTVTDVNLFLGRIVAERFPFPLDREATRRRLRELAAEVTPLPAASPSSGRYSLEELAEGLLRIANANMAAAIRSVTVSKGADPTHYVLVAFGGAAPQHACAVARELGIRKVLNHPEAGVLSALGIGLADVARHRSYGIERALDERSLAFARQQLDVMERAAVEEVRSEGVGRIVATRSLDVRYRGVESSLTIAWPEDDDFGAAFAAAHRQRYGYTHDGRALEIVAAHVEVVGRAGDELPRSKRMARRMAATNRSTVAFIDGERRNVPDYERGELRAGDRIVGPAIVTEEISTTVIDSSWEAEVLSQGELLLTDTAVAPIAGELRSPETGLRSSPPKQTADPVFLEIFNNHLASIAEQMGITLRNTASSVNVKERLDFSCAIFTADGWLVANAPHVPVHLGAMEETVRQTIEANPNLQPGDVIATNDPYSGGSHLPDVTVITPVFGGPSPSPSPCAGEGQRMELRFFTASRAHHAEIGGVAPGSMPPLSKNLAEEGVLIRNLKIVAAGESRFDQLRELLLAGPYPTRDVEANLADVAAQVAANRQGASDLLALSERYGWPVAQRYMEFVQDAAERKVRTALARFRAGTRSFTDYLETADGTSVPVCVRLTIRRPSPENGEGNLGAATIDFTGTGSVVAGNLNANRAIVTAAAIYVLRVLVDEDIPMNHGVLRPIEIVLPTCLLNPEPGATPETTPAVAGGNVETSQRIVDVLLGALGVAGSSQGTMNNVLFGDNTFGYYETICGGSGATADGPGASAVQVHMTNTRLTDPEILERRYPVRVREFSIRRGSGGAGRHRGGDGAVRRLEFLRPLTLSLLTERRGPHPPYGMAGGKAGAIGVNRLVRANGDVMELKGIAQLHVGPGDILVIETPGGGGYGQ
ncbi:MAG TPA: hydantoinase B/oxoprolinase family protein [Lacipirellulaceae bacterium]|nr:hydantoinase B/oxoprolinase family protein [Lacipirellulaceae bacterium]